MKRTLIGALAVAFACPAGAGVIVNGTRVVYPADAREVSVQIDNVGQTPSLIQAWIDTGDPDRSPDDSDAPFVLTPPISRIEPGASQALRIAFSGPELPGGRETVFWLNVLDVPPRPDSADERRNFLQVAFRSRLKLFYRPAGLKGQANDAPRLLRWQRTSADRVRVENPSAYHVSLTSIRAAPGGREFLEHGTMLAPGAAIELDVPPSVRQVEFVAVNDFGGRVPRTADLEPGP